MRSALAGLLVAAVGCGPDRSPSDAGMDAPARDTAVCARSERDAGAPCFDPSSPSTPGGACLRTPVDTPGGPYSGRLVCGDQLLAGAPPSRWCQEVNQVQACATGDTRSTRGLPEVCLPCGAGSQCWFESCSSDADCAGTAERTSSTLTYGCQALAPSLGVAGSICAPIACR